MCVLCKYAADCNHIMLRNTEMFEVLLPCSMFHTNIHSKEIYCCVSSYDGTMFHPSVSLKLSLRPGHPTAIPIPSQRRPSSLNSSFDTFVLRVKRRERERETTSGAGALQTVRVSGNISILNFYYSYDDEFFACLLT